MTKNFIDAFLLQPLVHLFQYLDDFEDLKTVTLVCKQWFKATQIPKILKYYKLCFSFINIGFINQIPLSLFMKSDRTFSNIYFENVRFGIIDKRFWGRWSETITELTFDYKFRTPELPGNNFLRLLLYTPNLKTLNLICSLHLCNQFIDELNEEERTIIFKHLKNVQELQMHFSEVCIDTLEFKPWLDEMPNLKNIDFDFYCKKEPIPSHAYEKIFYFLNRYGSKVKGLHICDHARPVDKSVVEKLLAIKGLKLKAFDHIINKSTSRVFTEFLCTQSELQNLTVNGTFSLRKAFQAMPKLKEIAIANGPALDGFEVFNHVPKLQSLGIAGLQLYDEDDIDLKIEKNLNLKELSLIDAAVSFELPLVRKLCESYPNLLLLNLDGAMIDDDALYYIFQLRKLQELKLSNTQITDAGVTGLRPVKKIGRKRRKLLDNEPDAEETYSINSLKELEVLNIDFCRRITGKSYIFFKFKKLKHLSGQGAPLTMSIFRSLGKNCPAIESLNFSKCNSLREKETEALAKSISGLETLELQACARFNKVCLQILMKNCKKLQTLDVSKCDCDVKTIVYKMFFEMKSLRRIMLEKERLYRCQYTIEKHIPKIKKMY